jgi:hypothetical protein
MVESSTSFSANKRSRTETIFTGIKINIDDYKKYDFLKPARRKLKRRIRFLTRRSRLSHELNCRNVNEIQIDYNKNDVPGVSTSTTAFANVTSDLDNVMETLGNDIDINYGLISSNNLESVGNNEVADVHELLQAKFKIGDLVEVLGRCWVGINKPGGVGRVVSSVYSNEGRGYVNFFSM